jgi:hypothetical protein
MNRWGVLLTVVLAGCLPVALVDPATCRVDPSLEETWLAKGQPLEQCMHDDIENGPGTQQSIFLVKAFDERCYLITVLDYYLAADGRLGMFGPGHGGALSQWRAWLASIGERQYLICNQIEPVIPADPNVVRSPGSFYPTFEIERMGTTAVTLKPDVLQRLELLARIKADPDAAAPGDPAPITVHRMEASTEPHVQRVLEAFHIVDPLHRPMRFTPPLDGDGTDS